jgi:hypothetical protein
VIEQTLDSGDSNKFTVKITVTSPFWKLCPTYNGDDADANQPKIYTINVTRDAADTNTDLNSLSIPQTALTVDGDSTIYAGTVASNVETLNINAAAAHPHARVQIKSNNTTYPADLKDATNSISEEVAAPNAGSSGEITVKVTAEDDLTTKDYKTTIVRDAAAAGGDAPLYNASGALKRREVMSPAMIAAAVGARARSLLLAAVRCGTPAAALAARKPP